MCMLKPGRSALSAIDNATSMDVRAGLSDDVGNRTIDIGDPSLRCHELVEDETSYGPRSFEVKKVGLYSSRIH